MCAYLNLDFESYTLKILLIQLEDKYIIKINTIPINYVKNIIKVYLFMIQKLNCVSRSQVFLSKNS